MENKNTAFGASNASKNTAFGAFANTPPTPEEIKKIKSMDLDFLFSDEFQKNFQLKKAFQQVFKEEYQEIDRKKEINYSTNHVTFHFFKNSENGDVRILRAEQGCFHSNQKFVGLDFIEKQLNSIKENKDEMIQDPANKDKIDKLESFYNPKIQSLEIIIDTYKKIISPSNETNLKIESNETNKPKI